MDPYRIRVGDLVTSTAFELKHPDLKRGVIGRPYIFFGIVQSYTTTYYVGRATKEHTNSRIFNVDWSGVETCHNLIKCAKKNVGDVKEKSKINSVLPTHVDKVCVIAKQNNPYLDGMNGFLKDAILTEYYFI